VSELKRSRLGWNPRVELVGVEWSPYQIGDLSLAPVLTMETFPPALSLEDGMQLNVANVNVSVTGLGAVAQNDNVLIDGIISQSQTVAVLPLLSGVLGRTLSSALGTLGLPLNLLGYINYILQSPKPFYKILGG
jgi:hypothetical protein